MISHSHAIAPGPLLISVVLAATWRHAVRGGLVTVGTDSERAALIERRLLPSGAAYLVAIGTAFVAPILAVLGYLVVALAFMVPVRRSQ